MLWPTAAWRHCRASLLENVAKRILWQRVGCHVLLAILPALQGSGRGQGQRAAVSCDNGDTPGARKAGSRV